MFWMFGGDANIAIDDQQNPHLWFLRVVKLRVGSYLLGSKCFFLMYFHLSIVGTQFYFVILVSDVQYNTSTFFCFYKIKFIWNAIG